VLRGSVYRVERADGSIEYTNVRPGHHRGRKVTRLFTYIDTCAACSLHSSIDWSRVPLNLTAYSKAVSKAAKDSGVSPAFLRAIIHAESAYDPNALSSAGAQGLMQLMPATASSMGVADAFNATQNIQGGARYLAALLKDFHGDHKLAAAAYNAGPGAVRKYDGVPPYPETEVYVKRVGTLYQRYAKALSAQKLANAGL
ncbi:MAG TPA: lytic transglycosylase domain-containing protein, partial [Oleiagrimonas sp.]|nr:lytic transglycosylase domain-containing protein [Oleiagrimonas sp.]